MNQYSQKNQKAVLLNKPVKENKAKVINDLAVFEIEGKKYIVPTIEAYYKLVKKIEVLEQRLSTISNTANRAARMKRNDD
jgi:nitrogen regulatory protein PII-like uncharacterized protein